MRPVALMALVFVGCAGTPGEGFASLTPTARLGFASQGRALEGGWMQLDTDFQVRLSRARANISAIHLGASSGGSSTFDPARPPPGYSLCHNGHCHRSDGA